MVERRGAAEQQHWEIAKVFWDGPRPEDRRQVWFSHRDPVEFAPDDYEEMLWRLGEAGFEPVAFQALPRPGKPVDVVPGPACTDTREITLFKRPLGPEPTPHAHGIPDIE